MNTVGVVTDRILILLTDDNRFVRRKALNDIKAYLTECLKTGDCVDFPFSSYAPGLSTSLNDSIEVNRELAIAVNHLLISSSSDCSGILPSLLPILVKRLGQKETVEPSEELRLETLRLLKLILEKSVDVSPYVDDYLLILQHSFLDPYHEVKKLSCIIIQELAKKKLHRFYQASESIVAPMLSNLVHQHSKVRLATVQAVGTVMIYSHGKLVEQTIIPLTQRLFDTASSIRYGVIEVVGSWLLDLPDRYSYHTKLLPLLLSGLVDDSPDVRDLAEDLWHDVGLKFEKENEEQLKDKLDFDKGPPSHYPLGCKRPVLGCRELVYRSASRLLPALSRDLGDWQASTRSKAASLIPVLILHLEQATTQHTQHLLTGLGTGLTDAISRIASSTSSVALLRLVPPLAFRGQPLPKTDLSVNQSGPDTLVPRLPQSLTTGSTETAESLKVIHQLLLAAQLTGSLVEAKLWWPLLKSCLGRCTESVAPASLAGHLFLLAGFVCGSSIGELLSCWVNDSPSNQLQITNGGSRASSCTILHHIISQLAGDDLLSVISFGAKAALLECVLVIVRRLEEAVFILRSSSSSLSMEIGNDPTNLHTEFSSEAIAAAETLFGDSELRSWLFQILLALGAVWADGATTSTDFGTALLQLTDEVMCRLAACERDFGIRSGDPVYLTRPADVKPEATKSFSQTNLLELGSSWDVDQLYTRYMLQLFQRLEAGQTEFGSWHPRSVGLAIFSRCLQTAGSALLMNPSNGLKTDQDNNPTTETCLPIVLRLLERGCRLDRVAGADTEKSPGGSDPLTMASEAELRLRGLILLTRLTDDGPVRTMLASPTHLSRCLTHLVLPACVWRAGRTAEAMRKAAVTCLVALMAAATSTYDLTEANMDNRTLDEIRLDVWLCNHVEPVLQFLGSKTCECDKIRVEENKITPNIIRSSSLPHLPSSILSLLLARLGGLLEDELEVTRRMACLNLTILFNGLLLQPCVWDQAEQLPWTDFLSSPTWLAVFAEGQPVSMPNNFCPLPNSLGDQVYRFYPSLIKRLNDAKDQIRLLVTETLNAWLRLVNRMLTCSSQSQVDCDTATPNRHTVNSVHSAVVDDFIQGLLPHLDDADERIRAAVARVMIRIGHIAPAQARTALVSARERHRAVELCNQLMQSIQLCD
ncbi:HEAT repeat containing protein [Paragonimus westermani]|uniref:HEAT repeat containing protein n=1 Tax=Paragonimus westermani TaxID=34504 RepID=A0A8T0D3V3_9TREM|nr:HEAT repeat containing protein [Paragonimus westermani]